MQRIEFCHNFSVEKIKSYECLCTTKIAVELVSVIATTVELTEPSAEMKMKKDKLKYNEWNIISHEWILNSIAVDVILSFELKWMMPLNVSKFIIKKKIYSLLLFIYLFFHTIKNKNSDTIALHMENNKTDNELFCE